MAKKPISISLPTDGSNASVTRGMIDIAKGQGCVGLRLKMTVPLTNTSGGAVTLTDAQKQLVLANFLFTLNHGPQGKSKLYTANDGRVINRSMRRLYGSEIEGYVDTSTGLQRSLPNSATTSVTFFLVVPFGRFWKLWNPDQLAAGRTQMRTMQLDVRRLGSVVILSGVVLGSTTSIDIMPDCVPTKGDPVSPLIAYEEVDDAAKTIQLSEGIPFAVEERNAAHAATALTNFSLKIDDLEIHDQVTPAESITEQNDVPNYPAEASPTDRVTDLYTVGCQGGTADLAKLPTGRPTFTQNVKDIATAKLSQLYVPIPSPTEVADMMTWASSKAARSKRLKGVSKNLSDKLGLGANSAFAAPYNLVDEDNDDFERFPGPVATQGMKPEVAIPNSVLDIVKARHALHKSHGEHAAAENTLHELAASIPGGVQSARGFKRGDVSMLDRVRAKVA